LTFALDTAPVQVRGEHTPDLFIGGSWSLATTIIGSWTFVGPPRGLLDWTFNLTAILFLGACFVNAARAYGKAIENFTPLSSLAAKRANEQIKSMAQFFNTMATAIIGIVVIGQIANKHEREPLWFIVAFIFAFFAHLAARHVLGLLKCENVVRTVED
jgi:hypothetical protein